jgi:hypothetical protein
MIKPPINGWEGFMAGKIERYIDRQNAAILVIGWTIALIVTLS